MVSRRNDEKKQGSRKLEVSPESKTGIEDRLAHAVYSTLRRADPTAFIEGGAESKRTTIDGTFNLEAVARLILWDLRDSDLLHESPLRPSKRIIKQPLNSLQTVECCLANFI